MRILNKEQNNDKKQGKLVKINIEYRSTHIKQDIKNRCLLLTNLSKKGTEVTIRFVLYIKSDTVILSKLFLSLTGCRPSHIFGSL